VTGKTGSQPNQDWSENAAPGGNSAPSAGSANAGCSYDGVVAPCIGSTATGASGWGSPTFDDEFNGSSIDTSKWIVEGLRQPNNPQEYACYSPGSVSVSGGYLHLALQDTSCSVGGSNYQYTGAQIRTRGLFSQTYGYYESRIYSPGSNGTIYNWGGFWLTGANWPAGGEIDVFESFHGAAGWHFMYPNGSTPVWQGGFQQGQDYTGWHIYAVDWEPGYIRYYYDGKLVGTSTRGILRSPMHLLLTYSTGPLNNVGGPVSVPQTMKVDYVRAWTKN
jgi:beta-glucanase (GH16 family)